MPATISATLQRQHWDEDQAIDLGRPEQLDLTGHLVTLTTAQRRELLVEAVEQDGNVYSLDDLVVEATGFTGPTRVEMDTEELACWIVDQLDEVHELRFLSAMGYGPDDWHDADLADGDRMQSVLDALDGIDE